MRSLIVLLAWMCAAASHAGTDADIERRVSELLSRMTLAEKIGQMNQLNAAGGAIPDTLRDALRAGQVGALLNEVDVATVNALQRIAVDESRLGIPLLIGRDVIHGFETVFPIPLGQAATFHPELVRDAAARAALEAARSGVNWTFAPMMDIARDARWGRIAESLGEDPYLTSRLAVAMIEGFQGEDPSQRGRIAACAKHFAGYGAAEAGRDYDAAHIPRNLLRNVYLRPFRAAVDAGVLSLMTSFSELDGMPATADRFLLDRVLRQEWGFRGFVVSDWDSVRQLSVHGLTASDREAALAAASAGVDMEMVGQAYHHHLGALVEDGLLDARIIDERVTNVLRAKFRLGLFEDAQTDPAHFPAPGDADALALARRAARESIVLLKNTERLLPLAADALTRVAVIGPLADAPYEQLGTWIFDGNAERSVTPLAAVREEGAGRFEVRYERAMATSRSRVSADFDAAARAAREADVALVFLGEESILSGEAHSRADIGLPGDQLELLRRVQASGTPVVAVILAGRPLTLAQVVAHSDALLYAWHPGTMGGPAIADLLFGRASPSAKLPATFPRMVGQIPIYYNHKNTGKPPSPEGVIHIDDIPVRAAQTSLGMSAFHLDAGYEPLFEFGYGLSYGDFQYDDIAVDRDTLRMGESLKVSATLTNRGPREAVEVAQLYVRDLAGRLTRPVRELKGFQRVRLRPGESAQVDFVLHTDDLAYYGPGPQHAADPGEFHAWIGGSSAATLRTGFRIARDTEGDPR